MADEFDNLTDETIALIMRRLEEAPPRDELPDNGYNLSAPASVIIPVATPLVNALPREPVPSDYGETLSVSVTRTKGAPAPAFGDAQSRTFAELIFALKCAEQVYIATTLNDWAFAHGDPSDPLWNAAYQSDISPEDMQRLCGMVRIGVAQDYQGHTEDVGDAVRYIVSIRIAITIQEPELSTAA